MGELRASAMRSGEECAMLRQKLDDAARQVAAMNSESGTSVDKRIVARLLQTYFDRNCSRDVLQLMSKILVRG